MRRGKQLRTRIVNELGKSTGTSLTLLGGHFINRDAPDFAVEYYIEALTLDDLNKMLNADNKHPSD